MLATYRKLIRSSSSITKEASALRSYVDSKPYYFFFKRLFDIICSFIIITFLLSWIMPLIALMIRLDSQGPVFFIQRRIGRGGRPFYCLKLRTMKLNFEADHKQAVENDQRITRVGRFLRSSSIDELPQFFNVLLGHMSIVGPRPHMVSDCQRFSRLVAGYKFRNMVRPGITGLAQVKGYRGPANDYRSILRRYQYDAFYIRQANMWLDLRIMRKTIGQMMLSVLFKVGKVNRAQDTEKSFGKIAA